MNATKRLLSSHLLAGAPLKVLCASGQLGYGIPKASFERGLAQGPDFIGADMGSIDLGPYFLGSGEAAAPRLMMESDLETVLLGARALDVPLIIGSAGTAGSSKQVDLVVDTIKRLSIKHKLQLSLVSVYTDLSPEIIIQAKKMGNLSPLGEMDSPSEDMLFNSRIVAQCGTETFKRALELDPDVLIVGRACDTAIFASLPEMLGYPSGLSVHMAKIIECSSLCCSPGGRDAIMAYLTQESFVLESMNPNCHATPQSVAAHAFYEQSDPQFVEEPMGTLDLRQAKYEQVDSHRTRVSNSLWIPRLAPTLKVEGAYSLGFRSVLVAASADPGFISNITDHLKTVYERVKLLIPGQWSYHPHVYGQGAVQRLPKQLQSANEVGLLIEFIAPTEGIAKQCAAVYKQNLLHFSFEGRICTAGNLAFPFSPSELSAGEVFAFSLYHILLAPDISNLFEIKQFIINNSIS